MLSKLLYIYTGSYSFPQPFSIAIVKPKAALPVNGIPRFVVVGKRDDDVELAPTPPVEVVTVFTTVDKTP